jgi:hypothetical protein
MSSMNASENFGQKVKEAAKNKTAKPPKPKPDPRYHGLKRRERTQSD